MVGLQVLLIALLAWDVTFGHGERSQGVGKHMAETGLPKRSHRVVPLENELAQLQHTDDKENERTLQGLAGEKIIPDLSKNLEVKPKIETLASDTVKEKEINKTANLKKEESANEISDQEGSNLSNLNQDNPEITPEFMDNYRKDLVSVMKKWNEDIPLQNYESVRWQKRKLTSLDSHLSDNGNIEIQVPNPKRKKGRRQRKGWGKGRVSRLLPLPNENNEYESHNNNKLDSGEIGSSNITLNDNKSDVKLQKRKAKKVRVPLPYTNLTPQVAPIDSSTDNISAKPKKETVKKRKNRNNKNKLSKRGKKRRKIVPPLS